MKHLALIFSLILLWSCSPKNDQQLDTVATDTTEAVTEIDSAKRKTFKDGVQVEVSDTAGTDTVGN